MTQSFSSLYIGLDLAGTTAFALSGTLAGVERELDPFGVFVLAIATALGGGILRDVLIGAVPPAGIQNWRYLIAILAAIVAGYLWYPRVKRWFHIVLVFDAVGLSIVSVVGTQKALNYGLNPAMAALLGVMSGVGGGVLRDVLTSQIPTVLQKEIYAMAALLAAAVIVLGHALRLPAAPVSLAGALLCFLLRILSMRYHWGLPRAWAK
jgi:uncharacterized membrane protein YeiH